VDQLLSGVEISNFGQQSIMGRYPIHFHVSEDVDGSTVEKNVIRQSNQRCVVIHGTHNVTIVDNVVYDAFGHCFMLEDGGEWDNTFDHNLGCRVKRHPGKEKWTRSDVGEPAVFLMSNPANHWIGNVATGSSAHGYWIETLKRVIGVSHGLEINQGHNPREQVIYTFENNVAHSNGMHGLTTTGRQYQFRTSWSAGGGEPNMLSNFKSYKNAFDGMFLVADNVIVEGGFYADNDRCINSDLGSSRLVIRNLQCTAISNYYRELKGPGYCHGFFDESNPDPGFTGVSVRINEKGKEATMEGIKFTGFQGLENCWNGKGTALQIIDDPVLNKKEWDAIPNFNGGFQVEGPAFDIKCFMLDWSFIDSGRVQEFKNVYVNDVDGSLEGGAPGAYMVRPDRDADVSAFVDTDHCTDLPHGNSCAMYCEGPCLRTLVVKNHAHFEDSLMVISNTNGVVHTYTTRVLNSNGHNFEAALPAGQYTVTFEDVHGNPRWPGYAKLGIGRAPSCSNHFSLADVQLMMPDSIGAGMCSGSMTVNGDFTERSRRGWSDSWFGSRIMQDGDNYFLQTTNRKLMRSNLYTWVDFSCVKPGETYRITGKMRLASQQGDYMGCDMSQSYPDGCPLLDFRLLANSDQMSPVKGFHLGKIAVPSDGWGDFDFTLTLPDEALPAEAYQAIVMFRGAKKRNFAVDDFKMVHVA
jgi:hypothetical protein